MGLYDDDDRAVRGGDVDSEAYWAARAAAEMLRAVLAREQPWNAIAAWLPSAVAKIDAALAVFPNHRDLQEWRREALAVEAFPDPDYSNAWGPGLCWSQGAFARGWAALRWARFLRASSRPRWEVVREQANRARAAWSECHDVHTWPADEQETLRAGLEEAERLADEAFRQMH